MRLNAAAMFRRLTQPKASEALLASDRLNATFTLVSSLESLTLFHRKDVQAVWDWETLRERYSSRPKPVRAALDLFGSRNGQYALHGARVLSSIALIANSSPRTKKWASAVNLLSTVALMPRNRYGFEGSDIAHFVSRSALTVVHFSGGNAQVRESALWYMGLQSTLSYGAAGVAKIVNPEWLTGEALVGALRSRTFGHEFGWKILNKNRKLAAVLSTGVVAAETLYPLVLLRIPGLREVLIALMGAFHAGVSVSMGLNRFIPAFGSLTPAVLYISTPDGTQRTSPVANSPVAKGAAWGAGVILLLGVLNSMAERRRLASLSEPGNSAHSDRANFSFGPVGAEHTVVVALSLGESVTAGRALSAALGEDYRVVCQLNPASLEETLRAASSLNRPSLLTSGYGWGSALSEAGRISGLVSGIVALNPQLPPSEQGDNSAEGHFRALQRYLRIQAASLKLGLGWMLYLPPGVNARANVDRPSRIAEFRSSGYWRQTISQLQTLRDFPDFRNATAKLKVPVVALCAGPSEASGAELAAGLRAAGHQVEQLPQAVLLAQACAHAELFDQLSRAIKETTENKEGAE